MNYFELLGLKDRVYDIDMQELNRLYLAMQVKYHPDNSVSDEDRRRNLSISIDLNKAYTILKDDVQRSEYTLSLHGIDLQDEKIRKSFSTSQLGDLWQILEEIEEKEDIHSLNVILDMLIKRKNQVVMSISESLAKNFLHDAVDATMNLKYISTIIENVKMKIKCVSNA